MKRNFLGIFSLISIILFAPAAAYASGGFVAAPSLPSIPAPAEGPGFILPESPLYIFDLLKQQVRLFLSFTPEQKAATYDQIAGERTGELYVELAHNNKDAALIALQGLRDNTQKSAEALAQAQLLGNNENKLASQINQNIKRHLQELDVLLSESTGDMRAETMIAEESLFGAKETVDTALSPDELANEMRDDLTRKANMFALTTEETAKELQQSIILLQQQASEAANSNLKTKQIALQKAILEKNAQLAKIQQAQIADERKKQTVLTSLQKDAISQTDDIVAKAQTVAKTVDTVNQVSMGKSTTVVLGASTSAKKK